ncbi:hypothetical protein D9M72_286570 [compost metagenome]
MPVVRAPRPPMLVICTFVVPLATALAPLSSTLSLALPLPPRTVPRASVPPFPIQGPVTVSTVPGVLPCRFTVPALVRPATRWLKPARSSVAPAATVCTEAALSVLTAPARNVPRATSVAPV